MPLEGAEHPGMTAGSPPADPLAGPVHAHLAAGRWRKARDEAKLLCKRDRPRYLPLLIEANVGLARDMIGRGLLAEAEQVVAYLRTIAPPSAVEGITEELACARGDPDTLRRQALRRLAEPDRSCPEPERIRLADHLVLGFTAVGMEQVPAPELAAELRALHEALASLCARDYEGTLERLRPLPRNSVFGHWKFFVKGLVAFYRGDRLLALRCFDQSPAGSIPAQAAAGYRLLIAEPGGRRCPTSEVELEIACRILGQPGLAPALLSADRAWRRGRHVEAYECLRRAVPDFPAVDASPLGVVSEFCFNSLHALPAAQANRLEAWFERLGFERKGRSKTEQALAMRAACLSLAKELEPRVLDRNWREYLALLRRIHGPSPRRDSLGYAWLGEQLASEEQDAFDSVPFFARGSRPQTMLRAGAQAVAALKDAVEADPSNLEAHLKLCEAHAKLGQTRERNRLLDQLTRQFPDRKEVLLLAGQNCLDRGALKKGLSYLESALALDRLDPAIPDALVSGRIRRAVEQYQRGRIELARQSWSALEEFIVESPDNLLRGRWAVVGRQGLLESLFGEATLGQTLIAEARAASPSLEACLLHLHFAQRVYAPTQRGRWLEEFTAHRRLGAQLGRVAALFRILEHWKQLLGDRCRHEEAQLEAYVREALSRLFTRDEAVAAVRAIPRNLEATIWRIADRMIQQDPHDPLFRLCRLLNGPGFCSSASPAAVEQDLQSIIEEAQRRGDDSTASAARSALDQLDRCRVPAPEPGPDLEDWGEEEDDNDSASAGWDGPPGPPSPADMAEFDQVVKLIADATPGQIKEMRRRPPPGMPREIWEMFIRAARAGGPPPGSLPPQPRPAAPCPPPPPRPRLDPRDQPELPF